MSREKKAQIIDSLQEVFSECNIGILTDYRGLSASEINALRRSLRESGIGYKVVKNTLARFAAERAGKDELVSLFEGPVAIAFGYGEITEPATLEEVETLSTLPSREILLARILGGMQIPMATLVNYLTIPIKEIIGTLQARIQQLEGE